MVRDGKLLRAFPTSLLAFGRGTEGTIKKGNEEYLNDCMLQTLKKKGF